MLYYNALAGSQAQRAALHSPVALQSVPASARNFPLRLTCTQDDGAWHQITPQMQRLPLVEALLGTDISPQADTATSIKDCSGSLTLSQHISACNICLG